MKKNKMAFLVLQIIYLIIKMIQFQIHYLRMIMLKTFLADNLAVKKEDNSTKIVKYLKELTNNHYFHLTKMGIQKTL